MNGIKLLQKPEEHGKAWGFNFLESSLKTQINTYLMIITEKKLHEIIKKCTKIDIDKLVINYLKYAKLFKKNFANFSDYKQTQRTFGLPLW